MRITDERAMGGLLATSEGDRLMAHFMIHFMRQNQPITLDLPYVDIDDLATQALTSRSSQGT
ncbi:MAG: hypothetical protein R3D99_10020 [Altererythrobacter sp.]